MSPDLRELFQTRPLFEKDNRFYFLDQAGAADDAGDATNRLKAFLRRWPRLYLLARRLVSTAFDEGMDARRAIAAACPDRVRRGKVIVYVGSGVEDLGKEVIHIDRYPYGPVAVVADASNLPFRDASVDMIVSVSLLEHCAQPHRVIEEMSRVVKIGGHVYCSMPFLYPFHGSPDDFGRFTLTGLTHALRDFEPIKTGTQAGPATALVIQLAYLLALLLSFGSERLYGFLTAFWIAALSPLKILDFPLRFFPRRSDTAAAIYFFGRKRRNAS